MVAITPMRLFAEPPTPILAGMQRYEIADFGGPDVLRLVDAPVPSVAGGQVRVKVSYAGLNFADLMQRRGVFPGLGDLPFTPGMEVVGTVDAVGAGVVDLQEGERVVARLELGGYAEYAIAAAGEVCPAPEGVGDPETLALVGTAGLTAYAQSAVLGPPDGRAVFLSAAAGGVGSILTQLLKAQGWKVLAGVSSETKAQNVLALGADHAIRYDQDNWEKELLELAGPEGLAGAFDSVGGAIYRGAFAALGNQGQMVVFGAASGELVGLPPELVFPSVIRCLSVRGNGLPGFLAQAPTALRDATAALFSAHREGVIPTLGLQVYGFDEATRAHADVEARTTMGKVVFKVA